MDASPPDPSAAVRPLIDNVLTAVHATPELAYEEVRTTATLTEHLERLGARVEQQIAGLATCFRAQVGAGDRPAIGIVVPLDAVPMHVGDTGSEPFEEIRPVHACGHSVIAGAVLGAAHLFTADPRSSRGRLVIMGIPGDEIHAPLVQARGGGKAVTAAAGVWDDLDAVLYAHPEFLNTVWSSSRWMQRTRIMLHGPRTLSPNSSDVGTVFTGMLRACHTLANRHGPEWIVVESARFEGDVEDLSPCGAALSVLVFGRDVGELGERLDELRQVIDEACTGSGLTPSVADASLSYEGILPNTALQSVIAGVFGASYVQAPSMLPFATDFGNVSQRIPGALIGMGRAGGWHFHTELGAEEFASWEGHEVAAQLAVVLAQTVSTLVSSPELLVRARAEFDARRAGE